MNIRGYQWSVLKKLLKQRFSELSDEDLVFERGKERELYMRLGRKTGRSQEDVARIIKGMQQAYLQQSTLL
ncbi:general stress protein CsbD [Chitinophaga ginsengisoli]|uniref:General stress protein CsbD n=1 Tax=Chitinophaga ginsengisoli TaxID=363837 RepID=A0A2P8GNP9_9BACT|nr:general stress protein CsbD [Chitinophaga ginsengisoli]PSL35589.1 hypothetical protein CLV42_101350 [Chitinophaga ginsengisoli]